MDLALLVYAISLLSKISAFLGITCIALALVIIGYVVHYISEHDDTGYIKDKKINWPVLSKALSSKIKFYIAALVITAGALTLIPSEKTSYTMVAAYAAQSIANDPKVQQLSVKVLKIVEEKLDSYIKVVPAK